MCMLFSGSGIFVSPSGLLVRTGSVGISFCIWLACGLLSLLGKLNIFCQNNIINREFNRRLNNQSRRVIIKQKLRIIKKSK